MKLETETRHLDSKWLITLKGAIRPMSKSAVVERTFMSEHQHWAINTCKLMLMANTVIIYCHCQSANKKRGELLVPPSLFCMDINITIISIIFNFLGSLSFARGLFITKKQAIKLGVSRFCGETDEENLKLPAVADRLNQRRWGIIGMIFISFGLIFELISIR